MKEIRICKFCVLFFFACYSIIQISYGQTYRTFRCDNGRFISSKWFCDNRRDCLGGYDEDAGCETHCGREQFSCDTLQCYNITVRCNTISDCTDGTDELNCGDQVNVKNCTAADKFLCRDKLRCLDIEYTCDGYCNCFDCSDENENCYKTDENLFKRCPFSYFVSANGPQCLCDDDQSVACKNIQSCDSLSYCEQRCIEYKGRIKCTCFEGYHMITDDTNGQTSCRSNVWYGHVILYATMLRIKSLNYTSKNTSIVQREVHNCTALTAANNYIYYATALPGNKASLFKSSMDAGTAAIQRPIIETDFPITSIAVDYITNNTYFTGNGSLLVCKNDGKVCTQLQCCGISYVAVAPKSGLLFYLQTNKAYSQNSALIKKANMDGSNETIIVDDVYRGNISIAVDESNTKIYLLEIMENYYSRGRIDWVSFDGEMKESVGLGMKNIRSMGVFDGKIFFTMDQKNDIFHVKKIRDIRNEDHYLDSFFRDNSTSTTKFLYVYNGVLQSFNRNPCVNVSCSGICLIKPSIASVSGLGYTCVSNDFTTTSDNQWRSNTPGPTQAASYFVLVTIILIFAGLGILSVVGYFVLPKQSWYQYYLAMRNWQKSKRDQRTVNDDQELF